MMSDFSVKGFLTEKTDNSLLIFTDLFIAHWIHGYIFIEYAINFCMDFAKLIVKFINHVFAAMCVCLGSTFESIRRNKKQGKSTGGMLIVFAYEALKVGIDSKW